MTAFDDETTKKNTPTEEANEHGQIPEEADVTAVEAASDDFDEELTLPETAENLNRMGMDTISCVGCQ